ncbi:MAG: hypothetical protein BWY50_00764 [Spirochaetes bacterium ADurb.Bin315]|nr:MAG: hypothetical protein BWY50_00764 [Spirochaetes bacterium ADurb.Bin315]
MAVDRRAEQLSQFHGDRIDLFLVVDSGQRLDRIESIEEEVGIHLALQRFALRFAELLLLLAGLFKEHPDLIDHHVVGVFKLSKFGDLRFDRPGLEVRAIDPIHSHGQRGDRTGDRAREEEAENHRKSDADDEHSGEDQIPPRDVSAEKYRAERSRQIEVGVCHRSHGDDRRTDLLGPGSVISFQGKQRGELVKRAVHIGMNQAGRMELLLIDQVEIAEKPLDIDSGAERLAKEVDHQIPEIGSFIVVDSSENRSDHLPSVFRSTVAPGRDQTGGLGEVEILGDDIVQFTGGGVIPKIEQFRKDVG